MSTPQVNDFSDKEIRPISETLSFMAGRLISIKNQYADLDPDTNIPNDDTPITDGREEDGVSRITTGNIRDVMTIVNAISAVLQTSGYLANLELPCVRPYDNRG